MAFLDPPIPRLREDALAAEPFTPPLPRPRPTTPPAAAPTVAELRAKGPTVAELRKTAAPPPAAPKPMTVAELRKAPAAPAAPAAPPPPPQESGSFLDNLPGRGILAGTMVGEGAKAVVRGAGGMIETGIKGGPAFYAAARMQAQDSAKKDLAVIEALERGEPPPMKPYNNPLTGITTENGVPDERWVQFLGMTPEDRAAERDRLKSQIAEFKPTDIKETAVYRFGDAFGKLVDDTYNVEKGWEDSLTVTFGDAIGSLAGGVAVSALGGPIAAGALFTAAGAGESVDRAIAFDKAERAAGREGLTPEQINTAGIMGIAPGSTDLLPVEMLLGRLRVPFALRGMMAKAIGRIGGQAFIEGTQESSQEFLQNLIAREYNAEQGLAEGLPMSAAIGGGVGGLAQLPAEIARLFSSRKGRHGGAGAPPPPAEGAPAPPPPPTTGTTPPPPEPPAEAPEGAPAQENAPETENAPGTPPAPPPQEDIDLLRGAGWADEDIAELGEAERAAEVEDARRSGAVPRPGGPLPAPEPQESADPGPEVSQETPTQPAEKPKRAAEDYGSETTSWVIRRKSDGEVIMETFDPAKVGALNTDKYEAVPIAEHLASLNKKKPEDASPPEAPAPAPAPADDFDTFFDEGIREQFSDPREPIQAEPPPVARAEEPIAPTPVPEVLVQNPAEEPAATDDGPAIPASKGGEPQVFPVEGGGFGYRTFNVHDGSPVNVRSTTGKEWTEAEARSRAEKALAEPVVKGVADWITDDINPALSKRKRAGHLQALSVGMVNAEGDAATLRRLKRTLADRAPPKAARKNSQWSLLNKAINARLEALSGKPKPVRKGKPLDVIAFIRSLGGIKPSTELRLMDAHKLAPGLLNNKGMEHDKVREALAEAGYFGGNPDEDVASTTLADLYDYVGRGIRGDKIYRPQDEAEVEESTRADRKKNEREEVERAVDSFLDEYGYEVDAPAKETMVGLMLAGKSPEDALEIALMQQEIETVPPEDRPTDEEIPGWEWPSDEELQAAVDQEGESSGEEGGYDEERPEPEEDDRAGSEERPPSGEDGEQAEDEAGVAPTGTDDATRAPSAPRASEEKPQTGIDPTLRLRPVFDAADRADEALGGEAATAVNSFVGVGPAANKGKGPDWGLMIAKPLEAAARGESPEVAGELEKAFSPIREQLRALVGDTITLYRWQKPRDGGVIGGMPEDGKRAALSWTADRRFAAYLGGSKKITRKIITDDEIKALEAEYAEKGEVKIPRSSYTIKNEDGYAQIYDPNVGGHVTDTDSVRDFVEGLNDYVREDTAHNKAVQDKVITAEVPLDEVMWITDRANQSEFIVRNDRTIRVGPDGKLGTKPQTAEDQGFTIGGFINKPTTETGADGKAQTVLPGAEKTPDAKRAQMKADAPLKPKAAQNFDMDDGLFGDGSKQTDLLDAIKKAPEPKKEPALKEGQKRDANGNVFETIQGVMTYVRNEGTDDPFAFKSTTKQTVEWDKDGYPGAAEIIHDATREGYEKKLRDVRFKAMSEEWRGRERDLKAKVREAMADDGPKILVFKKGDRAASITRSTREDGMLQITNYDKQGPSGHIETPADLSQIFRDAGTYTTEGWEVVEGEEADAALSGETKPADDFDSMFDDGIKDQFKDKPAPDDKNPLAGLKAEEVKDRFEALPRDQWAFDAEHDYITSWRPDLQGAVDEAMASIKLPSEDEIAAAKILDKATRLRATRAKFDVLQAHLQNGGQLQSTTHLKSTLLTKPEHLVWRGDGIYIPAGKKFNFLLSDGVDQLIAQVPGGKEKAEKKRAADDHGAAPATGKTKTPAPAGPKPGTVGMMLASGEVVLTATGRETTPFPKLVTGTDRKTGATLKKVDRWLLQNALDEAEARGDDFNARGFRADLDNKSIPPATKDSAEIYLFDPKSVQPIPRPFLKPLGASAIKETAAGIKDAAKALDALFSTKGKLGSGPSFDEETYRNALPHFKTSAAHFAQAGRDIKAMVREMIRYFAEVAGMNQDAIQGMRPYIRRFVEDIEAGRETLDAPSPRSDLEQDSGDADAQDEVGGADVPASAGSTRRGAGSRGGSSRGGGRGVGGRGLPQSHAPVVGEGGNLELPPREPGDRGGDPADRDGDGGRPDGGEGLLDDHPAEETVVKPPQERASLEEKRAKQREAESIEAIEGNLANVRATLPFLHPGQQEDVHKAEERFAKPDGHGMLFTHGTGTGKSYLALGVIKRFMKRGAKNVLLISPSQGLLTDMQTKAKDLVLTANILEGTSDGGKGGLSLTTYANFYQNDALAKREWDLIVADEAHNLSSNQQGDKTQALEVFQALTLHPRGLEKRAQMLLKEWTQYTSIPEKMEDARQRAYAAYRAKADPLILEWRAKARPKALLMSATPFPYHFSLDAAEGYIFQYGPDPQGRGYNTPDARAAWYIQNLGYRMRTNRLTKPDADVAGDVMERELHEKLKRSGALTGRRLEVPHDYDRKFVLIDDPVGKKIDEILDFLNDAEGGKYRPVSDLVGKSFNYLSRMRLLEAIKARQVIPLIRAEWALGRKVVVFHNYNEGGGFNPFDLASKIPDGKMVVSNGKTVKLKDLFEEFIAAKPEALRLKFSDYEAPMYELEKEFGEEALIFNGTISEKTRKEHKILFQSDQFEGARLLVLQADAGGVGISAHDTTGDHQRALYNLGIPTRPTMAIQQEGRIYRDGQASDAMFRYLNTGTNWERWTFAGRMAERTGTAENLALGNLARGLRQSFIDAYMESDHLTPSKGDGKGGKEIDRALSQDMSEFERAKAHYFGQQKGRKNDLGKDYFATPEPLGLKMVEWSGIQRGEHILEPSAGHGAIARYFPEDTHRTIVEPSNELASRAALVTPGARALLARFEDLHISNKYHAIVMNPPFGHGGATAVAHLAKAVTHLANGGRIVAIIPRGPAAEKAFDKWYEGEAVKPKDDKNVYLLADISLPAVTFSRAGTSVATRVVVLEKQTEAEAVRRLPQSRNIEITDSENIRDFFDEIQDLSFAPRTEPATKEEIAPPPKEAAADAPVAEPEAPAKKIAAVSFNLSDGVHTKTGAKIYRAAFGKKVSSETYGEVLAKVKKHDGYYSRYDRAFLFKNPEDRAKFLEEVGQGEKPAEPGVQLAAMPPPAPSTSSIAFKKWFGKSKVVDRAGNPLVVYHGSPDGRNIRDQGFRSSLEKYGLKDPDRSYFFARERHVAATYADENRAWDYQGADPEVFPVYLSLQNPAHIDMQGGHWMGTVAKIAEARAKGHDGVIIENVRDSYQNNGELGFGKRKPSKPGTVYIAFDPTQVKSATENRGTFDPSNPSILLADGSTPQGWDSVDTSVPKISAEETAAIENDARSIIARIAGRRVRVAFASRLPLNVLQRFIGIDTGEAYGRQIAEAGGLYIPKGSNTSEGVLAEPLILLARLAGARTFAGHEAWHHVRNNLITDAEAAILDADIRRGRNSTILRFAALERPDDWQTMDPSELEAFAFQRYRRMQEEGIEVYGLHLAIRRVFGKLADILRQIRAMLDGRGYRSVEDIWEGARRGHIAKRDTATAAPSGGAFAASPPVESIAFKKWFGKSKVVNEDGSPRVVYHGTGRSFDVFVPRDGLTEGGMAFQKAGLSANFFTSSEEVARGFAEGGNVGEDAAGEIVMPVYLSMQNPYVIHANGRGWPYFEQEIIDALKEGIHDGVIMHRVADGFFDGDISDVYVVPRSNQIKSVANRGTFDPSNPSIMLAATPPQPSQQPAAQPSGGSGRLPPSGRAPLPPGTPSPASPHYTWTTRMLARVSRFRDNRLRGFQDQEIYMKRLQEALEEQYGPLPESLDTYLHSTLYVGRAGERQVDLRKRWIEPFMEKMKDAGIFREEIDEYLTALHAIERNDFIRHNRDPSNDEGSGMTDAEANAIIARVTTDPRVADFNDLERRVRALVKQTRRTLLQSGLIDQDTHDAWEAQYQHYVPLRGWEVTEEENEPEGPRTGRGYDIRGKEAKPAMGRTTRSDSPLAYTIMQAQQAIIRAEKNRVGKSILRLVRSHPNKKVWEVAHGRMEKYPDKRTGLVRKRWIHPAADWQQSEKLFGVKVNGKQIFIDIHNVDFRRAVKRLGDPGFGMGNGFVRFLARVARLYAAMRTQFDPEFVFTNFFRDLDTAMINAGDIKDRPKWMRVKALGITLKSIKEIFLTLRNPSRNTEIARYWEEYRQGGGKVSFLEWNDIPTIKGRIESDLKAGNIKKALRSVFDLISDLNTAVENGVRLAIYIRLRKNGMTIDRASFEGKELTVNFNRHGEYGPLVNMFYVFSNASIQGTTRGVRALVRSRKVQAVFAGLIAYGAIQNYLNALFSDDDDDGKNAFDSMPYWQRERNFIVTVPGGEGLTIKKPMAYFYNIPVMLGDQMMSVIRGVTSPEEAVANLGGTVLNNFNPLGSFGSINQLIAPTLLDPLVQIGENKQWHGGPLHPPVYDRKKPDSENVGARDPQWAVDFAQTTNWLFGGNVGKKGSFIGLDMDFTPAVIELWANQITGGPGRLVSNTIDTASTALRGGEVKIENVPFARRFIGQEQGAAPLWGRWYDAWDRAEAARYEVQQLEKAGLDDEAAAAEDRNAAGLDMYDDLKSYDRDLTKLRAERRKLQADRDLSADQRAKEMADIEAEERELLLEALKLVP